MCLALLPCICFGSLVLRWTNERGFRSAPRGVERHPDKAQESNSCAPRPTVNAGCIHKISDRITSHSPMKGYRTSNLDSHREVRGDRFITPENSFARSVVSQRLTIQKILSARLKISNRGVVYAYALLLLETSLTAAKFRLYSIMM